MPITIESRLKQIQVFNLPHESYCANADCACSDIVTSVVEENPRTGERAAKQVARKAPATLTLLAKEKREGLRDSILLAPEVKSALERGLLRVIEQTPMPPARKPARIGKGD